MTTRTSKLVDTCIALVLFALNLLILGPFLRTAYSDQPWNNGYIYMGVARVFRDARWNWNPAQFNGAPFPYLYPPVFQTLVGYLPAASLGRAFHLISGFGYALIPVCLYLLARALFGSRTISLFAAAAYSLFPSAAYAMTVWRNIAKPYGDAPWGFVAMVGYEEAAHAFGFPFALLSLAAAWRGRWVTASVLAAIVFLTNWPAMIGLCFMLAALAVARRSLLPVVGLGGVAYGLAAFWMTPGYFVSSSLLNRIVLRHTLTAAPFTGVTWLILGVALALAGVALWRRMPPEASLVLTWVLLTGTPVVAFTLEGNYLVPSPHRYMLEFNAGCVLAMAAALWLLPARFRTGVTAAAILAGTVLSLPFLSRAWKVQRPGMDPATTVAYQITQWFNENAQESTAFVSGELDSTFALWSRSIRQISGSGVSNFMVWAAQRQIAFGCGLGSEAIAELWLKALGERFLVVHEANSREYFHWFAEPEKFRALTAVWDNGSGDRIYRLPRPAAAVVVDLAGLRRMPPMRSTADSAFLESYVAWSSGKRPARIEWNAVDDAEIEASLGPDEAVLVKSNYGPGWHASGATLDRDPLGFLLIRGGPRIELKYGASWDTWLGRGITLLTILLLCLRVRPLTVAAVALIPAVLAYAVLLPRHSPEEEAFIRLQPPLINPGGIVDAGNGLVTVYGLNFGSDPHVWLGDNQAPVVSHAPQVLTFRLTADSTPETPLSIESNGCRGNAFSVGVALRK